MKLEMGYTYEFKGETGTIQLRFIDDGENMAGYYKCELRGGTMVNEEDIGTFKNIWKKSRIIQFYTVRKIQDTITKADLQEVDWYGRNIRINYKDPELLQLYIDMALQTGDKRWFNQLCKAQKEVSA